MAKFRKKPVVIEAFCFIGQSCTDPAVPEWFVAAVIDCRVTAYNGAKGWVDIRTLEGTMKAEVGDWIIKGVEGELYPCKPSVFTATYEPA